MVLKQKDPKTNAVTTVGILSQRDGKKTHLI